MNRGLFIVGTACLAMMLVPVPAVAMPAVCCSVFASDRGLSGRWAVVSVVLLMIECITGRMPGVLSLPCIAVAGGITLLGRVVAWNRSEVVRTVLFASVATIMMTALGVAVASFVYGRGFFAARLAMALPSSVWWSVPLACSLMIGIMQFPWRGGHDNLDMK